MQSSFIRRCATLACLLAASFGAAFAQENKTPKLLLDQDAFEFGQVTEGAEITHTFIIKNAGTADLLIKNVRPRAAARRRISASKLRPNKKASSSSRSKPPACWARPNAMPT